MRPAQEAFGASTAESSRETPPKFCRSAPRRLRRRTVFQFQSSRLHTDSKHRAYLGRSRSDASRHAFLYARSVPKSSVGRPQALAISFDISINIPPAQEII